MSLEQVLNSSKEQEEGTVKNTRRSQSTDRKSEFMSKQEILSVMAKYFHSKDFVLEKYCFKDVNSPNPLAAKDGYYTLEVSATTSTSSVKEYKFFVKRLSQESGNCFERAVKNRAFYKEIELYSSLFADFLKIQREEKNSLKWAPQYYFSKPVEVLVLEDLFSQGFYQVGRRECLDKEQLLAAMKSLAAFHTASIKFEEKLKRGDPKMKSNPRSGQNNLIDVYSHLNFETESVSIDCHPGNIYLEASIKGQVRLFDQLPGYARSEIEIIKAQLPDLMMNMTDWLQPSTKYRNVYVHGDLCTNNMFFRRTENGSLESILVDFQTVRYAPPAVDLMMLLHLNQRRAFRMKEMQIMIQTYYNMFSEELSKSDICIQEILPVKEFLDSCEEFTHWATLSTVVYLQTYLLSDEIIRKHLSDPASYSANMFEDSGDVVVECFSKDEIYHTRMTEAMNDLIKRCINF